jgi:hypothetical protein
MEVMNVAMRMAARRRGMRVPFFLCTPVLIFDVVMMYLVLLFVCSVAIIVLLIV